MALKQPKYKAVILIGGPLKGTRFRPLSFDMPKPLFSIAGIPMLQHVIETCCKVPNLKEILLVGYYQAEDSINKFVASMMAEYSARYNVNVRYLQEYTALGTAGGIYHFRDQIQSGDPDAFFLIHGDVCGDFPLSDMAKFHAMKENINDIDVLITVLGTEATRQQSQQYGCIAENANSHEIIHYVEKPSSFVSNIINCGVYLCSLQIFHHLGQIFKWKQQENSNSDGDFIDAGGDSKETISLEKDILMPFAGSKKLYVFNTTRWWSQMKTAGSAIYANRHYLELYHKTHPDWLITMSNTKGDVFIDPSAIVHASASIGPNVSIGKNAVVGKGVRIKESIILGNAVLHDNSVVLNSIIGWNTTVGAWSRVEGTPCDPNPNKPFAKMENVGLFNNNGRLNPSITVLGSNVSVHSEVIVLNCIVLPHKELVHSYKNEIIL